ncbi:Arm DNA-binding domain-containing protein [Puia sp. P3]|uniref:Arm DNA-binding domain-containing protein n=1 Tax=Puia sp. P3 TaxID=3423952 RepID=UPI003D67DDC7
MNTKHTFSILIWQVKHRLKNGKAPLSVRVSVNGERAEIRTNREIPPILWDVKAQRVKGNTEEAKTINAHLETIKGSLRIPIPFKELIQAGAMSIIDLSDTDSTMINNIVIANLLREIQLVQEEAYESALKKEKALPPFPSLLRKRMSSYPEKRLKECLTYLNRSPELPVEGGKDG